MGKRRNTGKVVDRKTASILFTEQLFKENPSLSIERAATQCAQQGYHLYRYEVSDIRKRVRMSTSPAAQPYVLAEDVTTSVREEEIPTPEETDMASLALVPATPIIAPETAQRAKEDAALSDENWKELYQQTQSRAEEIALRKRYVNARLDQDPHLKPQVLIGDTTRLFNTAVSITYAYECCRLARAINGLEPLPEREDPDGRKRLNPPQSLDSLVGTLNGTPVIQPAETAETAETEKPMEPPADDRRLLTYLEKDGARGYDYVNRSELRDRILKLYRSGIEPTSIELWKPATVKVQVNIDFE